MSKGDGVIKKWQDDSIKAWDEAEYLFREALKETISSDIEAGYELECLSDKLKAYADLCQAIDYKIKERKEKTI